ncbi:hypothetical protein A4X17_08070 [Plantibacter sp. H53]|uniref:DNA/RNA helicase domain-containing protein n=1 Tax=Plantibacter sp. H53 TaxID=1827323 RepID=UPI0007D9F185|nr:DNA/RNA helicase domain-containing protein [Plantibacter sp. H53]OAN27216.1 hypothetical protein A4X17_08070 [Plantibacter sp. H53]
MAVEGMLEGLFEELASFERSTAIVQGDPGTGKNIYTVLLTRGIRGMYVYVSDPDLRAHLRSFLSSQFEAGSQ